MKWERKGEERFCIFDPLFLFALAFGGCFIG